jgi:hypothetical protein
VRDTPVSFRAFGLTTRRHGGEQHGRWIATSPTAAVDAPPVIIELAARFRLPTRQAADRVACRIARDHDAHITVSRTRLLHPHAGWSVFVRLPQTRIGLERIRLVTDGFAELAEEHGGEMVWQATRPRRQRRRTG